MGARYPRFSATREALLLASAITFCLMQPSHAALTVSSAGTKHVACSGGVCSATAAKATLNVTDLQNMLAAGDVSLVAGNVAGDIVIDRAVTWTNTSALTLDAYRSITVEQPLSVEGAAGLTLTTNDGGSGGTLTFATQGYATLWDLSSRLTINGASYTLVDDIPSLAEDIASTPSGHFALAKPYDASADGTYANAAIPTSFTGDFEGLGNTISNFTVDAAVRNGRLALFADLESGAVVEGLAMTGVFLKSHGRDSWVATIAALSFGLVRNVRVSGNARMFNADFGGLVANNWGTVADSSTSIKTRVSNCFAGGVVEANNSTGIVTNSFATGNTIGNLESWVGGLVYANTGVVNNSYATGSVSGEFAGGLAAANDSDGVIENSYATGQVSGGNSFGFGGVVGLNYPSASLTNAYWDITTSQTNQGCGNSNCTGTVGLTDTQLKSGLPTGFDPTTWGQSATVNGGYPYLLSNLSKK